MVANLKKHLTKIREKTKRGNYWQRRKDSIYLFAARQICALEYDQPISVLDVGSNATPTLEWHREAATRLVSLDLRRPYVADGVESLTGDFLEYEPESRFGMVTCFQVLEHVPDAGPFAQKLLQIADVAVVSVPYKWKRGSCKWHVHDPVDERKMRSWFRREPDFSYIACELNTVKRLINVYRT